MPWLSLLAGRAEHADALNDETPELLWHWDVRDAKVLSKAVRPDAMSRRKRLVQVRRQPDGPAIQQMLVIKASELAAFEPCGSALPRPMLVAGHSS